MSTFDINEYLANKAAENTLGPSLAELDDFSVGKFKKSALQEETENKLLKLKEASAAKQANLRGSWVGKAEVAPDTAEGVAVNLAANLASGSTYLAGQVASLPLNMEANSEYGAIGEEAIAAANRTQDGTDTPEDRALLAQSFKDGLFSTPEELTLSSVYGKAKSLVNNLSPSNLAKGLVDDLRGKTVGDRINRLNATREASSAIMDAVNIEDVAYSGNKDAFRADIQEGMGENLATLSDITAKVKDGNVLAIEDIVSEGIPALASLIANAGSATANNKVAVAEYIAQNLPQLATGIYSKGLLATTNVAYAMEYQNKGVEEFRKANEGRMPNADEYQEISFYAASLAAAEQIGDTSILKHVLPSKYGVDKAAKEIVEVSSKRAAADAIGGQVKAMASEAATEGYQTFAEAKVEGKDASAADIYEGAVIGAAVSGGLAAPSTVSRLAAAPAANLRDKLADNEEATATQVEKLNAATETGDVSAYISDPKSKEYSPDKAIAALMGFSKKEDATTTQKEEALKQATEILNTAKAELERYEPVSKEEELSIHKKLGEYKDRVAKGMSGVDKEGNPYTDESFAAEKAGLTKLTQLAEKYSPATFNARKKKADDYIKTLETRIEDAQKIHEAFATDTANTVKDDPEASVNVADTPVDPAEPEQAAKVKTAVDQVISMAMQSPGSLSAERATQLADNLNNSLTEPQREFMREFSAAQIARKSAEGAFGVNQDIIHGSKDRKQMGIASYQSQFAGAVLEGSAAKARKTIESLASFGKKHASKLKAMREAHEELTASGSNAVISIAPNEEGIWVRSSKKISDKQQKAGAGFNVVRGKRSEGVIAAVVAENEAINLAYKSLLSAGKVAFNKAAANQAPSVQPAAVKPVAPVTTPVVEAAPAEVIQEAPEVAPTPAPVVQARRGKDVDGLLEALKEMQQDPETYQFEETVAPTQEEPAQDKVEAQPEPQSESAALTEEVIPDSVWEDQEQLVTEDELANIDLGQDDDFDFGEPPADFGDLAPHLSEIPEGMYDPTDSDQDWELDENNDLVLAESLPDADSKTHPGMLSIFNGAKEAVLNVGKNGLINEAVALANLIKVSFTQKAMNSPLLMVQTFLGKWANDFNLINKFLPKNMQELSKEQENALKHFVQTGTSWMEDIEALFPKTTNEFSNPETNFLLYFINEADPEAKVDQNLKTAIALSAYTWVVENSGGPLVKDENAVRSILGLSSDVPLTNNAHQIMHDVGDRRSLVTRSLGQRVLQATGITLKSSQEAESYKGQLENALGVVALGLLLKRGLVQPSVRSGIQMAAISQNPVLLAKEEKATLDEYIKKNPDGGKAWVEELKVAGTKSKSGGINPAKLGKLAMGMDLESVATYFLQKGWVTPDNFGEFTKVLRGLAADHHFIRVAQRTQKATPEMLEKNPKAREFQTVLQPVQEIREVNKGTGGIVGKVFGVETTKYGTVIKRPSLRRKKGEEAKPRKLKGTKLLAPTEQSEALDKVEDQASYFRKEMFDLLGDMSPYLRDEIFGVKLEGDVHVHVENRLANIAKNEGLTRQWDTLQEFMLDLTNAGIDVFSTPLFFLRDAWKNQRVGILGEINPQTQKVTRAMVAASNWQVDVPVMDNYTQDDAPVFTEVEPKPPKTLTATAPVKMQLTEKQAKDPAWVERAEGLYQKALAEQAAAQSVYEGKVKIYNAQVARYKKNLAKHAKALDNYAKAPAAAQAKEELFFVGVAESFGVKSENQWNDKTLADIKKRLKEDEVIGAGLAAISKKLFGDKEALSHADEMAIAAAVAAGGEKMHSLDALVALATYYEAKEQGQPTAKITLMREVDGKTNGPALTMLQLGAAASAPELMDTLERAGMYTAESEIKGYTDWYNTEGQTRTDMYESLAKVIVDKLDVDSEITKAIYVVTGSLTKDDGSISKAGRELVKTPLTEMMFGSQIENTVDGMASNFADSVYERIEKIANDKKSSEGQKEAALETLFLAIRVLVNDNNIPTAQSVESALTFKFTPHQKTKLKFAYTDTVGQAVQAGMQEKYAVFLSRRESIIRGASISYTLYEIAHKATVRLVTDRLIEANKMPFDEVNGVKVPRRSLSKAELEMVDEMVDEIAPRHHTAMSLADKDPHFGMLMAKVDTSLSQDPRYASNIGLGSAVPAAKKKGKPQTAKTMQVAAFERALASPGVGTLVGAIHSTDSAIALRAYKGLLGALNVHDALGLSLDEFIEGSRRLNEATFHTMLEYSSIGEIEAAIHRTIIGFAKVAPSLGVSRADMYGLTKLEKSLKGSIFAATQVWEKNPLAYTLSTLADHRADADKTRLTVLSELGVMDQYPNQLGQYEVTNDDRTAALEKLAAVSQGVPVEVTQAMQKLRGISFEKAELAELPPSKAEKAEQAAAQKADARFQGPVQLELVNALEDVVSSFKDGKSVSGYHPDLVTAMESLLGHMSAWDNEGISYADAMARAQIGEVVGSHITQILSARLEGKEYSVWGKLGTPVVPSDSTLARSFAAKPTMSGMELVRLLKDSLFMRSKVKNTAQNRFERILLQRIEKALKIRDVKVVYVTHETPPSQAKTAGGVSGAYGWTTLVPSAATGKTELTVYIKSPDFTHSNVNHELLLHEMLHVALMSVIEGAKKTGNTTAEGRAVAALEALLVTARSKVMANPQLKAKYSNAVVNVHEFTSWGMTNAGFQAEVLDSIVAPNTKELSLFRRLIRSVVNMLFPNHAELTTGMHIMVERTTVLLATAAKQSDSPITSMVSANQNAPESVMNKLSLEELYDGLGTSTRALSKEFDGHLRGLMESITSKLHLPNADLRAEAMRGQAFSTEENWLRYVATGQAPYAASALSSDFNFTQQEALMVEEIQATVAAALDTHEGSVSRSQKEMLRTFRAAEKQLSAADFHNGDWATATIAERDKAQGLYDFVFDRSSGVDGRSDYLSRFVAISLAYEPMYKALKSVKVEYEGSNKTVVERLTAVMYAILDIFQRWTIKHTGNEQETLKKLTENLVDIEAKRRSRLASEQDATENAAFRAIQSTTTTFQKGMVKVGNSKYLRNNKLSAAKNSVVKKAGGTLLKAAGITLAVVGNRNQEAVMTMIERARDASLGGKAGIIGSLWTEAIGETDDNTSVFKLLRAAQRNEQVRKELRTEVAAYAASGFKNGKDFSTETKRALTRVLLRAGLSTLIEDYSLAEIEGLLTNSRGERKAAIAKHEAALAKLGGETTYYTNQAKFLALYKTKGLVRSANLVMNGYNIATLAGTSKNNTVDEVLVADATNEIKALIALYSLDYSNHSDTLAVGNLLRDENSREDGNGVDLILRLHKKMEEESKARIFQGAESLMVHGYTPEIFNPHNDIVVDTLENEAELKAKGYVRKPRVIELDPTDPDRSARYVYVQKYGGIQAHITGVTSLTSRQHKGQGQVGSGYKSLNSDDELSIKRKFGSQMDHDRTMAVDALFSKSVADARSVGTNWMAPVMNTHGEISDFRYLMMEENKDDLLERNNDFAEILGVMAGSIFDKETTLEQNRKAVQAIKDQYDLEFTKNPKIYLRVGANDKDAEMAEIYRTFPKEMHENIREIWGEDAMYVRRDQTDLLFGYRKSSISSMFNRSRQQRHVMENLMVDILSTVLLIGKSPEDVQRAYANQPLLRDIAAGRKLRIAGDIWDAFVSEAKDILVVKTGMTLVGNISSNVVQLLWHGVSPAQIIRDHRIALKGALAYRGDSRRLMAIENMLKSGYNEGDKVALQREAVTLKDSLAKNPVKGLIDAGLMPTIVEDVTLDEDAYSYQSMLANKLEGITSRIPAPLRKLGKGMYMAHDTQLYHVMSQGTQLSDFVARYTLYQHETTRKESPLSNEAAIRRASEAFVNYDIPTNRTVQWMNDKGLFMFTKYYIRIQKTLLMLFREQPARALGVLMLGEFLDGLATPMDSTVWSHIGNPLHEGALLYPTSIDDMATVKLMMSPF